MRTISRSATGAEGGLPEVSLHFRSVVPELLLPLSLEENVSLSLIT